MIKKKSMLRKIWFYWVIGLKIFIASAISMATYGLVTMAIVGVAIGLIKGWALLLYAVMSLGGFAVLGYIVNRLYKWR